MAAAEQDEVVQVGASAGPPGDYVVQVAVVGWPVAGFPPAVGVAVADRLVLPRCRQPAGAPHIEYFGVGAEDDAGQFRVAGEALGGGGRDG